MGAIEYSCPIRLIYYLQYKLDVYKICKGIKNRMNKTLNILDLRIIKLYFHK